MKKLLTLLACVPLFVFANPKDSTDIIQKKVYNTLMLEDNESLDFDGKLNEGVWNKVEWGTDFTVQQPNNGDKPKRQSQFKVLYDNSFLYVGYRCFHEEPTKIENRLSRRDQFPGDWVEVNIDSYHDLRTGFSFTASVSGVRGDEFITSDGENWDSNWNPIWYVKTNIDDEGWTAEIKIPLSQLRFSAEEEQVWGLNVMRRDFGNDERSTWQHIPQNSSGWVSQYGELHGIKNIKPKRQVEIMPYVLAKTASSEKVEGNPFRDGSDRDLSFGLDGKIGLTNDLTLDFTVNPDFGQVEADPSALTLDGFQIFFDERRPFFVENANLFDFKLEEYGGRNNLFYSRRIGQSPRGYHNEQDLYDNDTPDFTTIIGSAKLSGKTKNGLSIGILESVTAEEKTLFADGDREFDLVAEPLTNYFVGKISQDINNGATVIGGALTSVTRRLDGTGLEDQYHSDATTGGLSMLHTWKDREWQFRADFTYSDVRGTAAKITDTQESFEHYYQRPDAEHLSVDNTKTSLTGHSGALSLANFGGKDNLSMIGSVSWASDGLELNDIGFLNSAGSINQFVWTRWRSPKAFGKIRSLQLQISQGNRWTYNKEHLGSNVNFRGFANFTNGWNFGTGFNYEFKSVSTKALFGGPKLAQNKGLFNWIEVNSDSRKKTTYGFFLGKFTSTGSDAGGLSNHRINLWGNINPTNALSISISPRYSAQNRAVQNVAFNSFNNQDRYVTARVDQRTFMLSMRANYSLSPNISVQYWGQPFISKGNYTEFKYITSSLAKNFEERFQLYDETQISQGENAGDFSIDEDRDGLTDYSFGNPDFNFLQFRSNLVIRWEYKPGSEFFLVWTQSTTNTTDPTKGLFDSLGDDLFTEKLNNTFLMKFTHRFMNN